MIKGSNYLINFIYESSIFVLLRLDVICHANIEDLNILIDLVFDILVSAIDVFESLNLFYIALYINRWLRYGLNLLIQPFLLLINSCPDQEWEYLAKFVKARFSLGN
jgi:hypothetical protein